MKQSLAEVTGVETIKTLVGAMGVPDFTVDELAKQTGVSRRTVDTVRRRYMDAFERMPSTGQRGGPGRPAVRWALRSDHLDEIVAAVDSHQAALGPAGRGEPARSRRPGKAEASLILAAAAIGRQSDDPYETAQLVSAARHSLSAAGFAADGSPLTAQPPEELVSKARLVSSVADLVEACASGEQARIDEAQARAMPFVVDSAAQMSVAEWLPLARRVMVAPGTVLSAPVLVAEDSVDYFTYLFPTLETCSVDTDVPPGFVCMADARADQPAVAAPVTSLVNCENPHFGPVNPPRNSVVVGNSPDVLWWLTEPAQFILDRSYEFTKTNVANAVNSRACGFDLMAGPMYGQESLPYPSAQSAYRPAASPWFPHTRVQVAPGDASTGAVWPAQYHGRGR
jgi:hypothetical protein